MQKVNLLWKSVCVDAQPTDAEPHWAELFSLLVGTTKSLQRYNISDFLHAFQSQITPWGDMFCLGATGEIKVQLQKELISFFRLYR